ncbi:hypothetical protein DPMN_077211 [Dreissena polymorpha]|uniref:HAT C-terminal dimerisation domain-containing protein n=1 Tax=Dreissena polymorpha TaxID=45954 RepID=A0A9D3YNV3_DREPO|nr:hypothetical protein DPMN_077211 [Dreissena polymorpha]
MPVQDTAWEAVEPVSLVNIKLPPTLRVIYPDVAALIRILLTMQATHATSEKTFSALRRIKTYQKRTMSQSRLNNL